MPFGRQLLTTNILGATRVSADGQPFYKPGGIMIDTAVIPAAPAADVALPDGSIIRAGNQYLRYGQVLAQETGFDVQTFTTTGTATGGSFTLTYGGVASAAIVWNATAAQFEAALLTIPALAALQPIFAGGPFPATAVTMTINGVPLVLAVGTNNLTGTTPVPVVTHTTTGTATAGKFGPFDPAASDGRQTLTRGRCYVLDETWLLNPAGGSFVGLGATDTIGGVIEGGLIWPDRVIQSGVAAHSLAAGPTFAEFLAAFPTFRFANNV